MSSVPPANLNLNPNPNDLVGRIALFNQRAELSLKADRERYPNQAAWLRRDGPTFADRLPPTATTVNINHSSNLIPGSKSHPVNIKTALPVLLWTICRELPQWLELPAAAKKEQWPATVARIVAPVGLALASDQLFDALKRAIDGLFSSLCALTKCSLDAKAQLTLTACGQKAAQAALTPVCYLIKTLYHLGRAGFSKSQGDHVSAGIEMNLARQYSVADVCLQTASAGFGLWASGIAAATAVATLGAGLVANGVGLVVFTVYQTLAEPRLERIKFAGGFMSWVYSWVCTDRRRRAWHGVIFEQHEDLITDELRCKIFHDIVVDGLRHKVTGTLYNRRAIETWVMEWGTEPMTGLPATLMDYVHAPVAERYAREIAELLGARAQPVIDSWAA